MSCVPVAAAAGEAAMLAAAALQEQVPEQLPALLQHPGGPAQGWPVEWHLRGGTGL